MLTTTLQPSEPFPLPFAPSLHARAFTLRRPAGDLVIYAAPRVEDPGGISAQYLNHWHEATFGGGFVAAPLVMHETDAPRVEVPVTRTSVSAPKTATIPGHTPGATARL